MKLFFKLIVLFNCSFIFVSSAFAKTLFIDSPNPPPGFESADTNKHLRVSVLFMHQYIGFFYIDLHGGQLTFNSPERLLSHMVGIENDKKTLHLLNQSFPLNIECFAKNAALPNTCEKLKKKPIYIIYNPDQETVYLYLAPAYFKKPKKENEIRFIPDATVEWSYINKLGAAGSFSNEDPFVLSQIYSSSPNYYNLYSNNIIAHGNSSVIGNLTQNNGINNGEHFQIQNLYAQHMLQDKVYMGGYIVNSTSPFFQTQTIAGVSLKTTLETVKNAEEMTATPLVIFVPQASQVSIFKNELLIFSQYLEAGYQRINTSSFPEGGYELTIKIGGTTTTRQFFTKGFSLPPEQAPQFYVMGGYLTNGMILNDNDYNYLPEILDIPVFQAGMNKRVSERMAFMSDVLVTSHQGLLDFGPTFFLGNAFVRTEGLIATKNNYGLYMMFNAQKNRFNINLIATKIVYEKKTPDYYFLNNLIDNDSVSISYRITERDLLGIQANYNKSLDQPHSYNAGIFYQRQLVNYNGMGVFFNAGYNKAIDSGDTYNLGITVNFSQNRLAGTEALLWQNQAKNDDDNQVAVPVVVQGSTVYSHQNEQQVGYAVNEIHTVSPTVSSLAGTYNYTSNHDFVATYVNYNRIKDEGHSTGYGGNLETELALNPQGARFNGINRGYTSGIIVEVDSSNINDKSAKFALLDANNRKIALLPANQKIFISLPAFTDQNYTLINLSKSDYFIEEPVRHITLYPGNVGYYSWSVEKRVIVIGRIMTQKGTPLTNTWIHAGKNGIYSDSEGYFQLELAQNTTELLVENTCKIHLPKLRVDKAYLYIGDALCF